MSVEQMRAAISKAYDGQNWKDKVTHMSDDQVLAVYYRFLNNGNLK